MGRLIAIVAAVWLQISTGYAGAASIEAQPCNDHLECGDGVKLELRGRIEKGDLEKLSKHYTVAAMFQCLNPHGGLFAPLIYKDWLDKNVSKELLSSAQLDRALAYLSRDEAEKKRGCDGTAPFELGQVQGSLSINSPGGDLSEAMAIGRWIRKNRFGVVVRDNCASACIWILAAGLTRSIDPIDWVKFSKEAFCETKKRTMRSKETPKGADAIMRSLFSENGRQRADEPCKIPEATLQIHRPYLEAYGPDSDGALKKALQESKHYFQEMGIPPELAERMFSIESWNSVTLSKKQISCYRLNQPDMDFAEESAFVHRKREGISREEQDAMMKQIHKEYPQLKEDKCD